MSRARSNKENRPKRPSTLGLLLGGTGGRKDASKGAEAERQRRRRERDRSREMAAYVGYDAMYRDGIAQVMPGVFSQTVEFSDISYQSARKEARETAFTVMSSLFNYFPADSHVQLQVVNAPIPADEVGRKVFFEPGERATAGLAEEYNRILNDKMREGVSNLVRHRYLTYAVGADDVDAAVPKLARIRGDVEQTLARIRCSSRALDGVERLELLQGQAAPGVALRVLLGQIVPRRRERARRDFVMPSTLDFKPEGRSDCFRSDGRYGAVLAVRSFGSVIEETYLASIIDLPLPLNVTLHVQPIAQSEALALVKRQIDWMDKEIIDEQMSAVKKGYDYQILPPELRFSKEEAEELLDFLRNKSERLFVYTGLGLHLGRQPRGARPPRPAGDERRAGLHDRPRAAPLPAAPGSQLGAPARGQPRHREPLPHHGAGGHADALRQPEPRRGGRRLLRAVQGEREPGAVRPQAPGEPHGLRVRQARIGQELPR